MLTIETIDYQNQVSKVWEEVSSMLEEKYLHYKAQFDAPYSSSEPTEEEKMPVLRLDIWLRLIPRC